MSTNISDIMFEMESAGMPKDRVRDIVIELLIAGRKTLLAAVGEIAGEPCISETELELTVANIVAMAGRETAARNLVREFAQQREGANPC